MEQLEEISQFFEQQIEKLFTASCSALAAREDSRAFGGMVEKKILDNWDLMCKKANYTPLPAPGKRSIFDFACLIEDRVFGFDVKTKDLDSNKYSDGGVCAVGNLLKFMANDHGVLMIVEVGHSSFSQKSKIRSLEYVRVAPFYVLPEDAYRIENLGTGQIRLNYTLNQVWDEIAWDRSETKFFDFFCAMAINHYKRVKSDAEKRIKSIIKFQETGYEEFKFIK